MLLNEIIDLLASSSIATSLDGMAMVFEMNAGPLHGVIALNIENLSITCCLTGRGLLAR